MVYPVPPKWYEYDGLEYFITNDLDVTDNHVNNPYYFDVVRFDESRAACQAIGGDLAMIKDQSTLDWLQENLLPDSFSSSYGRR